MPDASEGVSGRKSRRVEDMVEEREEEREEERVVASVDGVRGRCEDGLWEGREEGVRRGRKDGMRKGMEEGVMDGREDRDNGRKEDRVRRRDKEIGDARDGGGKRGRKEGSGRRKEDGMPGGDDSSLLFMPKGPAPLPSHLKPVQLPRSRDLPKFERGPMSEFMRVPNDSTWMARRMIKAFHPCRLVYTTQGVNPWILICVC